MRRLTVLSLLLLLLLPAAFAADEVLYTGIVTLNYKNSTTTVYAEMDKDSKKLAWYNPGKKLEITAVYPNWVEVKLKTRKGYILRHRVDNVVPVDSVNTPPYGVEVYTHWAVITQETPVLAEPSSDAEVLSTLTEGARVAFIGCEGGWAKLVYHRQYAWVDTRLLEELLPVAGAPEEGNAETPLAVFCSFYNKNEDRIVNLKVACSRLERVMQTNELLDFNGSVGPFTRGNGYLQAPVLIDGQTKLGYGGGSCQISSTLYNTVLQLPGITIVERHPHGANGASYLPHGVDASSGDLNFRIRNSYDFPIRIEASCHDYCLFMAIYREE